MPKTAKGFPSGAPSELIGLGPEVQCTCRGRIARGPGAEFR